MKKYIAICCLSAIGTLQFSNAQAQFWTSLVNSLTGGLKIIPQSVVIPAQVVTKAAQNPVGITTVYQPVIDIARQYNKTIVNGVNVATAPGTFMLQQAQKYSASIAGKPGEFIFDISTFTQQYSTELGVTSVQMANNVLNGQNPFQVIAAPLAAAIHAARDRYYANSKPIPDDVKAALKPYFDANTLARARYAVGSVEISLPNLIFQARKLFGSEDYAVTVDDIMVFPKDPGNYAQSCEWWAHELTHVQQYAQWTVETFAYNYVKDYHSVENPAYANEKTYTNGGHCIDDQELADHQRFISQKQLELDSAQQQISDYEPVRLFNNEIYTAQCVLPANPWGATFLVTNFGRIIAVNPYSGESMHIGYAIPPQLPTMAWCFYLPSQQWHIEVGFDKHVYSLEYPVYNNLGTLIGFQSSKDIGFVQNL